MTAGVLSVALLVFGAAAGAQQTSGPSTTMPKIIKEVKPVYTAEGRAAKIQGTVLVSAVVTTEGGVSNVTVIRSLDKKYGLDTQAVNAASQWKFSPATRDGKPVPVTVTIELSFFLNSTK